jgi:hypothetical protein
VSAKEAMELRENGRDRKAEAVENKEAKKTVRTRGRETI